MYGKLICRFIFFPARSPAFSQVSTSLNGITTIRSCGAQAALQKQFDEQQDVHTGAFYMTILLTSGFGYWLDCVCMTFLGFVTFSFLFYGMLLITTLAQGVINLKI